MKERPILFSGAMVRALLACTKTQTRRVVKLPHMNPLGKWEPSTVGGPNGGRLANGQTIPLQARIWHTRTGDSLLCPYGQPSDRLWVRETFAIEHSVEPGQPLPHSDGRPAKLRPEDDTDCIHPLWQQAYYRATDPAPQLLYEQGPAGGSEGDFGVRWKPSIHMPRWASRILLEITEVRVERLQDISEADARAEGASFHDGRGIGHSGWRHDHGAVHAGARSAYARLWNDINGACAWEANPWVWAVSFKRITPESA